jgi:hypothetical protein
MISRHEDAQALVRGTLLGARVEFAEFRSNRGNADRVGRMRQYRVTFPMRGRRLGEIIGSYELPCDATKIAFDARRVVSDQIVARFSPDYEGPQ